MISLFKNLGQVQGNLQNIATDEELIKSVKQGDRAAFQQLYELYWKQLYEYTHSILQDQMLTEDCL